MKLPSPAASETILDDAADAARKGKDLVSKITSKNIHKELGSE